MINSSFSLMTTFEACATELLFEIFDYIDIKTLIEAFQDLNQRFDHLVALYLQYTRHWNFQSLSKKHLQSICKTVIPTIAEHLRSLDLSNADDTPEQIEYFIRQGLPVQRWIHLQSLSLSHLHSVELFTDIFQTIDRCEQLVQLKITKCQVDTELINDGTVFNRLWSLPRLERFYFQREPYLWNPFFIAPQITSTSIQLIDLHGFVYNAEELDRLFDHTPGLRSISLDLEQNYEAPSATSSRSMIDVKRLKVSVAYSSYVTNYLLHFMPQLAVLIMELNGPLFTGLQWEKLIRHYLPNLKQFHLKHRFDSPPPHNEERYIEQILQDFRRPFWIEEHRWYVQCHWYSTSHFLKVCLYTLPYYFKDFKANDLCSIRSSHPDGSVERRFAQVKSLDLKDARNNFHYPSLRHLNVRLSVADSLQEMILPFHSLHSLTLHLSCTIADHEQLADCLRPMVHLQSLKIVGPNVSSDFLFHLKHPSIRRLSLYDAGVFDTWRCHQLIQSPLGRQCEVLSVVVSDPQLILDLVESLLHLRALHVRHGKLNIRDTFSLYQRLFEWLKGRLPPNCSITQKTNKTCPSFSLWIG